ncbi:OmpA family protein [Pseudonocardia saturnea]
MRGLRLVAAVAVVGGVLAGCTGAQADDDGALVVVGAARANSAAAGWSGELEERFPVDVAAGRLWTFVTADGRPSVVADLPLTIEAANDLTAAADRDALHGQAVEIVESMRPDDPECDLLAALVLAGRVLTGRSGPRVVVVQDSLLQTTGALRFADDGGALLSADPAAVADELTASGNLPDLAGVEVVLVGAGDTVAPQDLLPPPARAALLALWTTVLERAGATVDVEQAPVVAPAVAGVLPVTPVPVAPPSPGPGPVALRDSSVGFLPDQAVLRDAGLAAVALAPFTDVLRGGAFRAVLTGTTSSAGTPDGRAELSRARAGVVADLMVRAGVPGELVEVRGVGAEFPGFVPDRGADGDLDPVLAALNRQVIVELVPLT